MRAAQQPSSPPSVMDNGGDARESERCGALSITNVLECS
jgi:hypothetical protein